MEIGKNKLLEKKMNRNENAGKFVGQKLEDVKKIPNLKYRITIQDGQAYFGTCDVRLDRYNFTVDNGIITSSRMG